MYVVVQYDYNDKIYFVSMAKDNESMSRHVSRAMELENVKRVEVKKFGINEIIKSYVKGSMNL